MLSFLGEREVTQNDQRWESLFRSRSESFGVEVSGHLGGALVASGGDDEDTPSEKCRGRHLACGMPAARREYDGELNSVHNRSPPTPFQ